MKSDLCSTPSLGERQIILGLFLIPNFGFKKITILFQAYKDWYKIWNLNYQDLQKFNFSSNLIQNFLENRNKINLKKTWNSYLEKNIHIITFYDNEYPFLLKQIYSPPLILFAQGNLQLLNRKNLLSVVGSRQYSNYGKSVIEKLIRPLAKQNLTIVSGLAIGIDSLAHIESLNTPGSTIAVLGSSLNNIYPRQNLNLAQKIKENGLLLSEFSLNSQIAKENFPRRNRIIAGLSSATLVIEARQKSGALITGDYALQENRELLATPGSIFQNNCEGTNNLIKQGAKLVNDIDDILEIYPSIKTTISVISKKINFHNNQEKIIYQLLLKEPLSIDKIAIYSRLKISIVISCLTKMELDGLIKNIGNQIYQVI